MSNNKVSRYQTKVIQGVSTGRVTYRNTTIVEWSSLIITLTTGGFETVTTKRKMNQSAREFGLDFAVHQHNFRWYVKLPDGHFVAFPQNGVLVIHR